MNDVIVAYSDGSSPSSGIVSNGVVVRVTGIGIGIEIEIGIGIGTVTL